MRLLLIRHAETPSNIAGVIDTRVPGPGLTALGQKQARGLIATVDDPVGAIAVSTQVRTALTSAPLASSLSLTPMVADGLREVTAGRLEMRGDACAVDAYLATVAAWESGALSVRMPGGEDGHEFLRRYDAAVAAVYELGCPVAAVFSHGCAIRTWVTIRTHNAERTPNLNYDVDNTEIVVVEGAPGQWSFVERRTDRGCRVSDRSVNAGERWSTSTNRSGI